MVHALSALFEKHFGTTPNLEYLTLNTLSDFHLEVCRFVGNTAVFLGVKKEDIWLLRAKSSAPISAFTIKFCNRFKVEKSDNISLINWYQFCQEAEKILQDAARILSVTKGNLFFPFDGSHVISSLQKLNKDIKDLPIQVRIINCLRNENIYFVGQLVQKRERYVMEINNFGRKSFNELKAYLEQEGLTFGMDVGDWKPPEK